VYVYAVKKGFWIGVILFHSDGYILHVPVHWMRVLGCLEASMRTSYRYWLLNLGNVLLLTVKTRHPTATVNQMSASYCYCQSNVGNVLLLTVKTRHPTATVNQTSAPYWYCQSNVGTLMLLTIKYRFLSLCFLVVAWEIAYTF